MSKFVEFLGTPGLVTGGAYVVLAMIRCLSEPARLATIVALSSRDRARQRRALTIVQEVTADREHS